MKKYFELSPGEERLLKKLTPTWFKIWEIPLFEWAKQELSCHLPYCKITSPNFAPLIKITDKSTLSFSLYNNDDREAPLDTLIRIGLTVEDTPLSYSNLGQGFYWQAKEFQPNKCCHFRIKNRVTWTKEVCFRVAKEHNCCLLIEADNQQLDLSSSYFQFLFWISPEDNLEFHPRCLNIKTMPQEKVRKEER